METLKQIELTPPYLIFLGDVDDSTYAKTGLGVAQWRPEFCIGQLRFGQSEVDAGLPDMNLAQALAAGAKSLILGVANVGGVIPDSWRAIICDGH